MDLLLLPVPVSQQNQKKLIGMIKQSIIYSCILLIISSLKLFAHSSGKPNIIFNKNEEI